MLGSIGGAMLGLAPAQHISAGDDGVGKLVTHASDNAGTIGKVMICNALCFCLYALMSFYARANKI
eukprot:COSAG05_NODE_17763_length_319_cov_1.172727_1_plen_65_part_10